MKQTNLGLDLTACKTRKRAFLDEMNRVVPWAALLALIEPHAPRAKTGRPPFALQAMLRIHVLQKWFGLPDGAMEEALFDVPLYREFAGLGWHEPSAGLREHPALSPLARTTRPGLQILATVNTTLAVKGLLLKEGTAADAPLIAALSSTKNSTGERDPEMH